MGHRNDLKLSGNLFESKMSDLNDLVFKYTFYIVQ